MSGNLEKKDLNTDGNETEKRIVHTVGHSQICQTGMQYCRCRAKSAGLFAVS